MPRVSTLSRLYTNQTLGVNKIVQLTGSEFHYLKSVMRLNVNDKFRLFNEQDGEFDAEISSFDSKNILHATTLSKLRNVERRKSRLALAISIIKKDKLLIAINGAIQLGISDIIPIKTDYCQNTILNYERIQKVIYQATEQSERIIPPTLWKTHDLSQLISRNDFQKIIFADENTDEKQTLSQHKLELGNTAILIGPEGGFSSKERMFLKKCQKILPISLGKYVLRSEFAAIAAISTINMFI